MKFETFELLYTENDYINYFGVIYKITNKINGKLYIGQSIDFKTRERLHEESGFNKNSKQYNLPLYKAIRKYGINKFSIEIIDTASSIDELNEKEIYYIAKLDTIIDHGKGYNLEFGGSNGLKSEYTKAKMRKSLGGINSPSYGKKGDDSMRAIKIIDLDTNVVYGSMIHCAELLYNDKTIMKQLSRVTDVNTNRLSYKGKHFARIDKQDKVYIKIRVAELLGFDLSNANGKRYITIDLKDLSKKA